jgi:hypothetical protein
VEEGSLAMPNICYECLGRMLRQRVGRQVVVETENHVYMGELAGSHVNGRRLKIIIKEGKAFRVVDFVERLIFPGEKREEVRLLG